MLAIEIALIKHGSSTDISVPSSSFRTNITSESLSRCTLLLVIEMSTFYSPKRANPGIFIRFVGQGEFVKLERRIDLFENYF